MTEAFEKRLELLEREEELIKEVGANAAVLDLEQTTW